jgi:hypothetical protein
MNAHQAAEECTVRLRIGEEKASVFLLLMGLFLHICLFAIAIKTRAASRWTPLT